MKFSVDELRRIQINLRKQLKIASSKNILGVGFGIATKAGKTCKKRPFAVTVFVNKKLKRPRKADRIPQTVEVRLKRRKKFQTFVFPTDVVEIRGFVLTGKRVFHRHSNIGRIPKSGGTTSLVVVWTEKFTGDTKWGIVSCAHIFPSNTAMSTSVKRLVEIDSSPDLFGLVVKRSRSNGKKDTSLVSVSEQEITKLLALSVKDNKIAPLSLAKIINFEGKGKTLRLGSKNSFVVERYSFELPFAGKTYRHVVQVRSTARMAFEPGTSGSCWVLGDDGVPGCVQFGAEKRVKPSGEVSYKVGYGQALPYGLLWARETLENKPIYKYKKNSLKIVALI